MTTESKLYSVRYWCTHPDEDNDDCHAEEEFDTKEEALAFFNKSNDPDGNYIEIDGPDINEVRMREGFDRAKYDREVARERRRYEKECSNERAMEAGMLHGVDAYNEVFGYD